jgi:transcriptional regulator with XRE-family HTH domain
MVSNRYRPRMADSEYDERFPERDSKAAAALASNCRRLRLAKNWSQKDLATKLKTKQTAITLIENGRANPTIRVLEKLAAALGVEFTELFRRTPKSRSPKK